MKHKTGAVIVALLLLTGCDDAQRTAAKRLNEAAHGIALVQDFAISAHESGLISEGEARDIVIASLRLSEAGQRAVSIMRAIRESDPNSKTRAIDALGFVADDLRVFIDELNIKNDSARHQLESLLLVVETALNSARVILAASE